MKHLAIVITVLSTLASAAHAKGEQRPKPCLTSECEKLTLAYDLSPWGMSIHDNTQAGPGKKLTWPWDSTGYFLTPDDWQRRNFLNLGMNDCYDPTQKPTPEQLALLHGIVRQLKRNYYRIPNFYWTVFYTAQRPQCINSSSTSEYGAVFLYTSLTNAVQWNRDDIAAVIAHEVGHLTDPYCETSEGNIAVNPDRTALQQICAKRADNIGIQYVVGAGFNPNGFVHLFHTLQQFVPTNVSMRYSANHPINAERISNLGLALQKLCREGIPGACQSAQSSVKANADTFYAPVPLYRPEPKYTPEARAAGVQGCVVLEITVDVSGSVASASVLRSSFNPSTSQLDQGLDQNAFSAVRTWRFKPATKNGKPVPVRLQVMLTFRQ